MFGLVQLDLRRLLGASGASSISSTVLNFSGISGLG